MSSKTNATDTPLFDTSYGLSVQLSADTTFEQAIEQVKTAFSGQGFGLPPGTTNLDIATIFGNKGFDFDCSNYVILGFCSPPHAFTAISAEKSVGLLVPCNVAVAKGADPNSCIEVSAIDPYAILGIVRNKDVIRSVVEEVRAKIQAALSSLQA